MTDPPALAVDACVAINVYATGLWTEIFQACGFSAVMAYQAVQESIWIFDEEGEKQLIDLASLVQRGDLEVTHPVDDELELLLELAARLGDGEAACMAIAHGRKLMLATDDRAARNKARELEPELRLHSTASLMRLWSERARPSDEQLRAALRRIEEGARFRPPASDPDAEWWRSVLEGD